MSGLILASASASRARLLEQAGVPFVASPAHVDEETVKEAMLAEGVDKPAIADALAELKAVRVSLGFPNSFVLGCDQVLIFGDRLVSKCADLEEARALLTELRGKEHRLATAAVLAKDGAPVWRHLSHSRLWMRPFGDAFLDAYLAAEGEALLGGVGCYRLEGLGSQLFERVEGDYFAILGLPLLPLLAVLREHAILMR